MCTDTAQGCSGCLGRTQCMWVRGLPAQVRGTQGAEPDAAGASSFLGATCQARLDDYGVPWDEAGGGRRPGGGSRKREEGGGGRSREEEARRGWRRLGGGRRQ